MEIYDGEKAQREKFLRGQIQLECERIPEKFLKWLLYRAAELAYATANIEKEEREQNKERLHIVK